MTLKEYTSVLQNYIGNNRMYNNNFSFTDKKYANSTRLSKYVRQIWNETHKSSKEKWNVVKKVLCIEMLKTASVYV